MINLQPFYSPDSLPGGSSLPEEGLEHLKWGLARIDGTAPSLHPDFRKNLLARLAQEPARVETDRAGNITSINPAFTVLCGYSFAEIAGKKPGHFLQGEDSDPQAVAILREAVKTARPVEVEIVNYHKDGSPYRVAIAMAPIPGPAGEPVGFRAVAEKRPLN